MEITLRINQLPPKEPWRFWIIIAGRGFGKTLAGAHCILNFIKNNEKKSIGLIGATLLEIKNVMLYGISGLINLCQTHGLMIKTIFQDNKLFIANTVIYLFPGDKWDKLRGFQLDCVWIDELAKFHNPQELINQVIFCCRINNPQFIITTTPRPLKVFDFLFQQKDSYYTQGTSYDNRDNLPSSYLNLIDQWKNTPLGRQEIYGEILKQNPSPWAHYIFQYQWNNIDNHWVLSIDPSVSSNGHYTGIIIAAYDKLHNKICIIDDCSTQNSVENWINGVVDLVKIFPIETIIVEVNQGGDLLEYAINKNLSKSIKIVKCFARHNKYSRSLSTAQLYWQNFIYHQKPLLDLEKQLIEFSGTLDRVDALVWAVEYLINENKYVNNESYFWKI